MKHFYLLYGMILLMQGVAMAGESGPGAALASIRNPKADVVLAREQVAISISGQVKDEEGSPFPGVNIVVKGTSTGTTTDGDGKYSIEVPDANSVLIFSFVGYAAQEVPVGGRTAIDVTMTPDIEQLDEVIVT